MRETSALAGFAAELRFQDIPAEAIGAAKTIIIDAIGVGLFGSRLPWCQAVASTTLRAGATGRSPLLDASFTRTSPRSAALINGTFIHSFEFDSLRFPNAGVHAGSTVWPAVFAMGSERSVSGEAALTALVAGCETAFRIGLAANGAFEKIGFHAPGITGVFGAAAAAGSLMKLDSKQMANAFGLAGSMCSGLLAFSKSGTGGAAKPLHMGRAAEAGVIAAELAEAGVEGSAGILEGKFGVLEAYAREADISQLSGGLGTRWETQTACIKKYACHVTAQTIVEGIRDIVVANAIEPAAIAGIELGVSEKVLSHHAGREPLDVGTSQYSVPMCAAIALHRDPQDPGAFLSNPQNVSSIREWARKIELKHFDETTKPGLGLASKIKITLRNDRAFEVVKYGFEGMQPLQAQGLTYRKFEMLTAHLAQDIRDPLFSILVSLELERDLSQLFPTAAPAH